MPPDPQVEGAGPRPTRPPTSQPSQRAGAGTSTSKDSKDTPSSVAGSRDADAMSDDESADESPRDAGSPSESVKSSVQNATKSESEEPLAGPSGASGATSMPLQKRRRVTRACDECRRKKIKCDGKQPCTHCSVYSYECTYDKPSNRRRNPAPQYIEALEARLQRAEALLRKFMPEVDLTDPGLDPAVQHEFQKREQARAQAMRLQQRETGKEVENPDSHIVSMIESIGQLDLNEGGEWDFYGISSGAVFLKRMKDHFQGNMGNDPFFRSARPEKSTLSSPKIGTSGKWESPSPPNVFELPPQERARELCSFALSCATCLLRTIHQPTFYEQLQNLYDTPQGSWGVDGIRFLGLLYAVMALGCMYYTYEDPSKPPVSYQSATEEGIKYFAAARQALDDVAECRDVTSLQALVYMVLFLQTISNITACYAYLGIALRSSLRMGLHRHLPHAKMSPIEDETRRRLFHTIRQLDTHISAILGFPILLHDQDVDQPFPTEVDDEYITKDAILFPPPGTPSFFQAFSAHNKLMGIMARVVKHIYPLKGVEECVMKGERPNATYMISYARIKEIERELHEWFEQLPIHWRPSPDGPIEVIRVRTLLRFAYAHVQMMLYRPFLHYISARLTAGKKIDDRYYNCAAAGISVSRNVVHIGVEIQKQASMIGPYWLILYTEFVAVLSLVFYVMENPDKTGTAEILADAHAGREVIATLAERSVGASRITEALEPLFEQLKDRPKQGSGRLPPNKKRSAPGPGSKSGNMPLPSRPGLKDSLSQRRSEDPGRAPSASLRREATAPLRTSFDTVRMPGGLAGQGFAGGSMPDLMPMDMSLASASPESSGAPGSLPRHPSGFPTVTSAGGSANSVYKLDAMMFPSGDPFAYPNQPLMDGTGYHPGRQGPHPAPGQAPDGQFYMSSVYDGIEGQLLGPIPPYLVPSTQGQHPMDPASQMYTASNMLGIQSGHAVRSQQPQSHGHQRQHQQQQHQHQRQAHMPQQQQHQHPDMMEDMMVDPNYPNDWDDMLNHPGSYR